MEDLPASSKRKRTRWAFALHNLVGHPLMEAAHLVGANRLARWFHRTTLPSDLRDAGRLYLEIEAGEYLGWSEAWLSEMEQDAARELYWETVKRKQQRALEGIAKREAKAALSAPAGEGQEEKDAR